ncbi:MAG: hypothetical protein M3Z11_11410 [Candidatus Dormibacteraeota bacterium]|nr:hypothetical protein [Candidatus Dormibacteraeota bacterium]
MFEALDYIYSPSTDVAAELKEFEQVLGARVVFAIEDMGTRVAMIELAAGSPNLLLAGHLDGEREVLVYRVDSLAAATSALSRRGWKKGHRIELPMGPACAFTTKGGHRLAIYERTRPDVVRHFEGRRDF